MDLFRTYATDETQEAEGVWRKLGDIELKIARDTNEAFTNAVSRLYEENREILSGPATDESKAVNRRIMAEAAADGLLKDWRGPVQINGQDAAYTRENAIKVLMVPDFMRVVRRMAGEESQYRLFKEGEMAKT